MQGNKTLLSIVPPIEIIDINAAIATTQKMAEALGISDELGIARIAAGILACHMSKLTMDMGEATQCRMMGVTIRDEPPAIESEDTVSQGHNVDEPTTEIESENDGDDAYENQAQADLDTITSALSNNDADNDDDSNSGPEVGGGASDEGAAGEPTNEPAGVSG